MTEDSTSDRLFREGHLSVGLVLPLRATVEEEVDFREQLELAVLAEALGFSAVWVRDVPLNGPWYPEPFGHPDPMVMLGAVAARTSTIALGTAAVVLPLRHPLHVAKAAISLDHLSGGRLVLGVGSGDRPKEFAAFGVAEATYKERYRQHWKQLAAALERPARVHIGEEGEGADFELRPPARSDIPMIAVGSGGQTLQWIARNAAGWATYHRPRERQRDRHGLWRGAVERVVPGAFRSFSVALALELEEDPQAPPQEIDLGYRTGNANVASILETMRTDGMHHVMLNLQPVGRPVAKAITALAKSIF